MCVCNKDMYVNSGMHVRSCLCIVHVPEMCEQWHICEQWLPRWQVSVGTTDWHMWNRCNVEYLYFLIHTWWYTSIHILVCMCTCVYDYVHLRETSYVHIYVCLCMIRANIHICWMHQCKTIINNFYFENENMLWNAWTVRCFNGIMSKPGSILMFQII